MHTPTVLQLEAVECGAAALAIILAHHGRIVALPELRRACGVSRDGSKASNMMRAARTYGMSARGLKRSLEAVLLLEPPFIVFWNFDHFLVVEGHDGKHVRLNDPASGHRKVTMEEFDRSFTGVALEIRPGPEFEKGGRKPSLVDAVRARLAGFGPSVMYCIAAGLALVAPGLALPALTQMFVDGVIIDMRTDWIRPLIVAIVAAAALQCSLTWIQQSMLRRLKIALSVRLSGRFFWHLMRLPMTFYSQRFAGEIASRSTLNDSLADLLSGRLATTVIDVVMALFYALLMYYYDASLTLVAIGFAVVNIAVLQAVRRSRVESNRKRQRDEGMLWGLSIAGLQSMETLKASGQEPGFFARWSGCFAKALNSRMQLELVTGRVGVLPDFLQKIAMTLVIGIGGLRVIEGQMTIGMLVAFQALMMSFLQPVSKLVTLGGTIQELEGDLTRIDDVLESPAEDLTQAATPASEGGHGKLRLDGHVELRSVTFGYSPLDPPLVENFNLEIRPGQRVALVGGSGSGKTTIANLICGLYRPWSGAVLFDHVPRDQVPRDVLLNSFAVVNQEVFLFEGTVRDNLTLWDPTVPDETLVASCSDAAILDTVLALPGGLDGRLLESGVNLSGGQRQRLEIARSLVQRPSILVLDEATSALDSETEAVVDQNLRLRGCTCVIIAHRLSTIRDCDEIIVMERGRVVERGTHDALWAADGAYARLIRTTGATEGAGAP